MNHLVYAKICMVLTIGLAGLNIHQFMSSYGYVREKIGEFKEVMEDEGGKTGLNVMSLLFYFVVPVIYLIILTKADFFIAGILLLSSKFIISAVLGLWTQNQIFSEDGYTRKIHMLGKFDNFLNILLSAAVVYLLLFPL